MRMDSNHQTIRHVFDSILPLSNEDWQSIEIKFKTKTYNEGDFVVEAGQVCDMVGIVGSGVFSAYWTGESKKRVFLFFFPSQSITDYNSFLNQKPSKAEIKCLSAGTITYLTHADHVDLLNNHPNYNSLVRLETERGIMNITAHIFDFSFLSAEERYLKLVRNHPDIFQQLPLRHISEYINIEPQSLSRIRNKLSKQ